jgi:hypothetical protein
MNGLYPRYKTAEPKYFQKKRKEEKKEAPGPRICLKRGISKEEIAMLKNFQKKLELVNSPQNSRTKLFASPLSEDLDAGEGASETFLFHPGFGPAGE